MMKKLIVLMLILGVTSWANAALLISVDGVVDPPDSQVTLVESQHAVIDIWSDGGEPQSPVAVALIVQDKGMLDATNAQMLYQGSLSDVYNIEEPELSDWIAGLAECGYPGVTSVVLTELADGAVPPLPITEGKVVDLIDFHCTGEGEAILTLLDPDDPTHVYDTQVIHQVPEPATIALLGLGGLFLVRRRR